MGYNCAIVRSATNEEDRRLMSLLLVEMDGLGGRQRVTVIATASQLDNLDQALFRVGRFDRRVVVRRPTSDVGVSGDNPGIAHTQVIAPRSETEPVPCPACKLEVQPRWKHCVYCGASLAQVCPLCDAPLAKVEGARFCFECGNEFP